MKVLLAALIVLMGISSFSAQPWMSPPYLKVKTRSDSIPVPNFYNIQKAYNRYEKHQLKIIKQDADREDEFDEGLLPGQAQYKRWEAHMEPRVYPSGDITLPASAASNFIEYLASPQYLSSIHQSRTPTAAWMPLGPTGSVTNGDYPGCARLNFIRFDPTNSNNMWVMSPTGGLWKSVDGGQNWTTNTDQLPIIGCSDIAIDPTNTQIMYLATGDANGNGSQLNIPSIGILKSTDGGLTWPVSSNTMNWQLSWNRFIYKLLIHPTHPDTVYAATSAGIYRTTNGGTIWNFIQGGQFTDIEFKPGNTNILYAASGIFTGGAFYKSTNGGSSFSPVTDGLPASTDVGRLEIGVTPADSNYVYVVAIKKNTYNFHGFYRSTDGGTHFTLQANTPDILAEGASSQAWYNLAMAVSPMHKDTILVGGTNIWRSTNGGVTWVQHTSKNGGNIPYVHVDHHAIEYWPGTDATYFSAGDGGIFKTTNFGASWNPINEGLQIAQMYKFGVSPLDPYTILTGHQDMGTFTLVDTSWTIFTRNTGDGMECIYEYDNDSIRYLASNWGRVIVTYNNYPLYNVVCSYGGSGVNAYGNWITPIIMHPQHDSTLLVGKAQVWRTTNGGQTFSQVGNVSGGNTNVTALAYAPSNPLYIYATKTNRVFVSTDGSTFVNKTGTLPVDSANITSVTVCPTDPKKVWVTFSGYKVTVKVWYSSDAGDTWSNVSTGLPNLPVNCLTYQEGSNDGLYAGTDIGIYYIDNTYTTWQPFFTGLPRVDVQELEIAYGIEKIRAATNGRGLWESGLAVSVPTVFTWTGAISTDWNNPGNWNPQGVPTIRQDVIIPDVNPPFFDPIVNISGLGCKNLTLQPGANMTIPNGINFKTIHN